MHLLKVAGVVCSVWAMLLAQLPNALLHRTRMPETDKRLGYLEARTGRGQQRRRPQHDDDGSQPPSVPEPIATDLAAEAPMYTEAPRLPRPSAPPAPAPPPSHRGPWCFEAIMEVASPAASVVIGHPGVDTRVPLPVDSTQGAETNPFALQPKSPVATSISRIDFPQKRAESQQPLGIAKAMSHVISLRSVALDLGTSPKPRLRTSATAAIGMDRRIGMGNAAILTRSCYGANIRRAIVHSL